MEFGVFAFLVRQRWNFSPLASLASPVLSQEEQKLHVSPPRAFRAWGLGRCVCLGSHAPQTHLDEASLPQSFGILNTREALSNELVGVSTL